MIFGVICATAVALPIFAPAAHAQATTGLCDSERMERMSHDEVRTLLATTPGAFLRCEAGYTPLHVAVSAGNIAAIRLIVEAGADIDAPNDFRSTPLHVAILAGKRLAAATLIDLGANIYAPGPDRQTPLEFAEHWDEPEIAQMLLDHGAGF